jgi:hypothetical protein
LLQARAGGAYKQMVGVHLMGVSINYGSGNLFMQVRSLH